MSEDICHDQLYKMPVSQMSADQRDEAISLFSADAMHMMEELEDYTNSDFDIDWKNMSDKQLTRFRAFNKALSEVIGRAYELKEISDKQNQKEAA